MSALTVGELFAGYGGLGMGINILTPARIAWVSEIDKPASRLLDSRVGAPNHGNITNINWDDVEPVDVLTGGFPCQDASVAGKRGGLTEGTRTGLWLAMRDAIYHLKPAVVLVENVKGLHSARAASDMERDPGRVGDRPGGPVPRGTGRVLGDLSSLGYDAQWTTVAASLVGAPHIRERVFVVAHKRDSADAMRIYRQWCGSTRGGRSGAAHGSTPASLLPTPAVNDMGASYTPDTWDAWTERMRADHGNGHGKSLAVEVQRTEQVFAQYAPAIRRWEQVTGRDAPSPTEPGQRAARRLSARFVEWMMGLPDGWVTGSDLNLARTHHLKLLGNGVVPQQAAYAVGGLAQWAVAA